ncbi:MAG: circadian clock protein KaiC [Anaerolineae bacterium]|nr:circadian clock protein KaiC [Anaerolineae bacterium]MDW8173981.1 circadian clock protein KaiC [Anaerolineae bacterium]
MTENKRQVEKLPTGIPGFDHICNGGLPKGRTTLVTGTAGTAKTVLACQFLVEGIRQGEAGVFVTFEESVEDIRRNMLSFGWDIAQMEAEGRWLFVDAARQTDESVVIGSYDLTALIARIQYAVSKIGAQRVSLDSLGAILTRYTDMGILRREMFRIAHTLKIIGVTTIMTAERVEEYGPIARYGVEEFVADNVIILRNVLEEEKRRRTIEILKFRGTSHRKGEFPFTIIPGQGIVAIPLSAIQLRQRSSDLRITSGSPELDRMCGGGFFRDSVLLVSGATGTGKTLMATGFMAGGAMNGERCLLFAFEESRDQLFRNAIGWGYDFEEMERQGLLKVHCEYPEVAGLEDHYVEMKRIIEEFRPNRVAIDSLSALERISTNKGFREFVIALTSFIKHQEVAGLFTSTTPTLLGGTSITEAHISTITDSIILLRYVEVYGEMRRGLTVLKMRGSMHDKEIREFTIDKRGMHIGKPFRDISGILSGNFTRLVPDELSRLSNLFKDEESS